MRSRRLLSVLSLLTLTHAARADDAQAQATLRAACSDDAQKFCSSVQPGGGRIIACLKEHKSEVSDRCRQAAAQLAGAGTNAAGSVAAESAATPPDPIAAPPAAPKPAPKLPPKTTSRPASAGTHDGFYHMKQVQITDPGFAAGQDLPAIDVLIPSDWQFKGAVNFGGGLAGCFSDLFAVSFEATGEDGALTLQGAPDYSWQYADDPAVLRNMTDIYRRPLGTSGKPCPVAKPMHAEEFLRQKIAPGFPSGSTIVTVEPFPELDAAVQRRLGLPADPAAKQGLVRTEAVRAHVTSEHDGKPTEAWVSVAVVTRIAAAGRGKLYDCHATAITSLRAPRGKLAAQDGLYKLIISSVHSEPKWQARSNAVLAQLYRAEARKEAMQSQIIANFQALAAKTIESEVAYQQQSSQITAYGADQNIRGVQTFRDPNTGGTFELSNQYDHAWRNGSDEYVMSEDPNFNPNGQLNGNWSQLQPVRPSP